MSKKTPEREDMQEWWKDLFLGFGAWRALASVIAASGVFGLYYFGGDELFSKIADEVGVEDSLEKNIYGETELVPAHEKVRKYMLRFGATGVLLLIGALLSTRARRSEQNQNDDSSK